MPRMTRLPKEVARLLSRSSSIFATATALITTLGKPLAEGKLDERLKLLTQPQLLICDELGYLPIDRQGANLFFQLVSRQYERGSIIITSNQSLSARGEVFGDTIIASAILDHLLHHSITIKFKGESFSSPNSEHRRPHERDWLFTRNVKGMVPLMLPQTRPE